jgi:hypothetical protein
MRKFAITGRRPCNENETYDIDAPTLAKAISEFINLLYVDREREGDDQVAVYLDSLIEVPEGHIHHYDASGPRTIEAEKYTQRKTAFKK